ncbi:MAG: radical SAM protein [Alistipes sp.]
MDDLLAAMHRELDDRRGYPGGEAVTTRHLAAERRRSARPKRSGTAGPRRTTLRLLRRRRDDARSQSRRPNGRVPRRLLEAGIDRLSIGVQSFDDDCLKLMNRRHTAAQAAEAVRAAQRADSATSPST